MRKSVFNFTKVFVKWRWVERRSASSTMKPRCSSTRQAMGKLRDTYLTVANPVVEMGTNDDQIAGGSANIPKMENPQTALTQCNKNPGKMMDAMGEIFPSVVFPNFGIGAYGRLSEVGRGEHGSNRLRLRVHARLRHRRPASPSGFGTASSRWARTPVSSTELRRLNRISCRPQPDLRSVNLSSEGVGLGTDVGLILTAPILWLPSISGVVRDVGGTSFTLRSGISGNLAAGSTYTAAGTNPQYVPQTINGAFTVPADSWAITSAPCSPLNMMT